jgi:hypothetical protein
VEEIDKTGVLPDALQESDYLMQKRPNLLERRNIFRSLIREEVLCAVCTGVLHLLGEGAVASTQDDDRVGEVGRRARERTAALAREPRGRKGTEGELVGGWRAADGDQVDLHRGEAHAADRGILDEGAAPALATGNSTGDRRWGRGTGRVDVSVYSGGALVKGRQVVDVEVKVECCSDDEMTTRIMEWKIMRMMHTNSNVELDVKGGKLARREGSGDHAKNSENGECFHDAKEEVVARSM